MEIQKLINFGSREITFFGGFAFLSFVLIILFIFNQQTVALKFFLALILSHLVVYLIRIFYFKKRPDNQKYKNFIEKIDASSFPSLHSVRVAAISVILINGYHIPLFSIFIVALSIMVLISRYCLKRHYLTDIIWGALIGIIIGMLINFMLI